MRFIYSDRNELVKMAHNKRRNAPTKTTTGKIECILTLSCFKLSQKLSRNKTFWAG